MNHGQAESLPRRQRSGCDGRGVLCRLAAVILFPEGTFDFFNAWMHGLDLAMLKSGQAMTPGKLVYGLFGTTVTGFLSGVVYAWSYNLAGKLGCCR